MDILEKGELLDGIQIQIKPLKNGKGSRSFTVYHTNVDTAYSRIVFLFEQLAKSGDKPVKIFHYNKHKEAE